MARYVGIILSVVLLCSLTIQAEKTDEFKKLYQYYQTTYPFISMTDTIYTFETEYDLPEGYRYLTEKELPPYAYWISRFPLWHGSKAIGIWRGGKAFEHDEISRGVHLPWFGPSFRQAAVPVRIIAEYYNYLDKRAYFSLKPKAGETIAYNKWMTHDLLYSARNELIFKPHENPPDTTIENWYKMLVFAMENTSYLSMIENSQPVSDTDLQPGDLFIGISPDEKSGFLYLILNMITDDKGNKKYCVATGCVEACDLYIPKVNDDRDNPWLTLTQLKDIGPLDGRNGFYRLDIKY